MEKIEDNIEREILHTKGLGFVYIGLFILIVFIGIGYVSLAWTTFILLVIAIAAGYFFLRTLATGFLALLGLTYELKAAIALYILIYGIIKHITELEEQITDDKVINNEHIQ